MKKLSVYFMMAVLAGAQQTLASAVISIEGSGSASGFQNIDQGGFDAQPVTVPVAGTTTDDFGVAFNLYTNDGRGIYIDFGEDWNQVTIDEVWMGLKQFGTDPSGAPAASYWSPGSTLTSAQDNGVAAPDFLWNWTADTSDKSWQKIWEGTETVKNRYYVQSYDDTQSWTNRSEELVFVGTIPEPSTIAMVLISFAAVLVGLRRRRS